MSQPTFTLANGQEIPCIGFGTYKLTNPQELKESIPHAVASGYRLIDTATLYDNESVIGEVLQKHHLRNQVLLATKVWPRDFGYDNTLRSIENSLKNLCTDHIDILYLHWPGDDMQDSWRAMEKMYEEGVVKTLAVSNFLPKHYESLSVKANIPPFLNQLELHPYKQEPALVGFFQEKKIQLVSWAPIAKANRDLFSSAILTDLSDKYQKTPAQIILRWHLQRNLLAIPKSKNLDNISENIGIFDFSLDQEDMKKIRLLEKNQTVSHTPEDEDWLKKIRYESI